MTRILVVDDEPFLADLVSTALGYEGYETSVAGSGAAAIAAAASLRPDLIVLDVLLPDLRGTEVCRRIRASGSTTPIIFLTAVDDTPDKIAALRSGGDDYVTKPFSLEELVARVQAVLRRSLPGRRELVLADLTVDEAAYEVRRGGRLVELTPTEFKLLRYLLVNAGKVVTKRQIVQHVWDYGNDGVVQTYISYLRRKVDHTGPQLIHTVPRVGYVMRLPRDA
ncbi:response regulator transcription factor [Nonomuraea sp. NPDC050310]|uniref:response regulator transcription factor n=1 Tax=unclassified Nonomuraea TaxID=2593643 RepID=UPI0033C8FA2D